MRSPTLFYKPFRTFDFGYRLYFSKSEIAFFIFEIFGKLRLQTLFCDYTCLLWLKAIRPHAVPVEYVACPSSWLKCFLHQSPEKFSTAHRSKGHKSEQK